MLKKFLLIGALLNITLQAHTEEYLGAAFVDKGEPAPFAGFLLTPQKEFAIREEREINLERLDNYKIQNDILSKLVGAQHTQIEVLTKDHLRLEEELEESKSRQRITFVAGVAATLGTMFVLSNVR
jgi:hypothetical protein